MSQIARITRAFADAIRPPPRQNLSAWIESNVILPDGVSALPGEVRLWPFQREIADCMADAIHERISVVKPVRVGYTTLLTSTIAGFVVNDPSPILAVLPTEDDCRDYVVSDVEPIFEATPVLASVLSDDTDEGKRNTILSRRFPGGSIKVVAAKSPRNLRRHNVRVLVEDEVDGYEVTKEGPPDVLAEKRTMSFPNRKIIKGSTPVMAETSRILAEYERSDKRIYEVPCPECGDFHEIRWTDIVWDQDDAGNHLPETACYVCPGCGSVVPERKKPGMVAAGRWRATAPHVKGHAGFRMNALISLHANASWPKLVEEFLAAKDDPALLQVFTNTILAEGWKGAGEEIDEDVLIESAEDWGLEDVPEEVLALTWGIDVQDDRLECAAVGWTEKGGMLTLGHVIIEGRFDDDETWTELDDLLSKRWPHRLDGTIGTDGAAVDAGSGLHMPYVMAFTRPRARRRIIAIKGEDGIRRPMIERGRDLKKKGSGVLYIVGSDAVKKDLFGRLGMSIRRARGLEDGMRPIRFSQTLAPYWYEQLASERLVVRYSHGKPVHRFERISGRRAEALDCVVYAVAVKQTIPIDWNRRRSDLSVKEAEKPVRPKKEKRQRSDWLKGGGKGFW